MQGKAAAVPGLRHDQHVVKQLTNTTASWLREAPFTYAPVGGTRHLDDLDTPGFRPFSVSRPLRTSFEEAAEILMTWRLHERAGLRVAASHARVEPGAVVLMRLGVGPAALRIPCRVVYVVDEPDRVGFAYGTLPGHPEAGEELFVISRDDTGAATATITAFSRPATLLARAAGPAGRGFQHLMTRRYLRAADGESA